QRAVQPAWAPRVAGGPRRLVAGAALQVDEPRPLAPIRVGDLTREDGDRLVAAGLQRHLELVLGDEEARDHEARSRNAKNSASQRARASSAGKWPEPS